LMAEELERALYAREVAGLVIDDCDHGYRESDHSVSRIGTQGAAGVGYRLNSGLSV
jgi:hypothetical protein